MESSWKEFLKNVPENREDLLNKLAGKICKLYKIRFDIYSDCSNEDFKTKSMVKAMNSLKLEGKTLFVLPEKNLNVENSTRNIAYAKTIVANTINIYDLLRYTNLVLTLDTVKKLEEVYA